MLDASITAIGGNVLWLDAADQTTIIDNDGDSVSSGNFDGQVAQWNDKSGNGNNLSHATGSNQPTYVAGGKNGNDILSFDGNDALYITDAAQTGLDLTGNGMTLIAVTNPTTTGGARILINKESSYEVAFQGGKYQAAVSTTAPGGWAWGGTSAITTAWHITGFTHADTAWQFHQERALSEQMVPANNQTGNIIPSNQIFTVGGRGGAIPTGSYFQGDMAEIILFDRALTDSERLDIEIYLSNKWGIALNNAAPTVTKAAGDLAQGASITINNGMLSSTDSDDPDADLIYTLSSLPTNGTLKLSGIALNTNDTFTQQDILDNKLTFTHDGSAAAGTFDFTVTDRMDTTAVTSFSLGFTLSETANNPISLNEGGSVTLGTADLEFGPPPDAWYDANWLYRQRITIDKTNIGSDLTDFTVLLTEANMNAGFWTDVKADGSDIVLTAADGTTKLSRELVHIDTVLKTMELHVKLPTVDAGSDTNFYLYFGNAAAAETNDPATWSADYAGVWHLDEAAGNAIDATGNGYSGTMQNGVIQGVAGAIGKGVDLDGSNDYINAAINKGTSTTFSLWATWDGGANDMLFLAGNYGAGPDLFFVPGVNKISWNTWNSSANAFGAIPASASDGNFHHYVVVMEPSGGKLYYDGALLGTAVYADPSGTTFFRIGGGDPNYTWGGMIDEVHVATTARSADWAAAEYANQKTPSSFYSVSAIQTGATPLTYTLTDAVDNGVLKLGGVTLNVSDSFTQDDIDSGLITYVHNDSNTTSDFFSFTVSDGLGNITNIRDFTFDITLVDDEGGGHIPAENPENENNKNRVSGDTAANEHPKTPSQQLIRSTFSGEGLSAFYGGALNEIVREGATAQIRQTLEEMDGESGAELPDGTPHILSALEKEFFPAQDHPLRQFLQDAAPEENGDMPEEEGTPLSGQTDGALLLEQGRFDRNVLSFLESIGGQA